MIFSTSSQMFSYLQHRQERTYSPDPDGHEFCYCGSNYSSSELLPGHDMLDHKNGLSYQDRMRDVFNEVIHGFNGKILL